MNDLLQLIEKGEIDFKGNEQNEGISEDAKDLIKKMLIFNPKKRISFEDFFNHFWINKIEKSEEDDLSDY